MTNVNTRALALAAAVTMALPLAASGRECAALLGLDLSADGVAIASAEPVPAMPPGTVRISPWSPPLGVGLPAHCKVSGTINQREGADGVAYGLGFELVLPDEWNGRFLFQGGGGLNGSIAPALGATAAGDVPALARGFAVVSTDGGHKGQGFDASFMADQRATLDFVHASVGTVTDVAKTLVAAHYGRPEHRAYLTGCSTGGREGMLAMQRYPEMFDGVIIGAPAMRTGFSNLGLAHAAATFNRAAPLDKDGRPDKAALYSAADKRVVLDGLLAQCDALDGRVDGFIEAVAHCRFDPAELQCKGGQREGCLNADQVVALRDAFKAPINAAGQPLYVDFPYDTGIVFEGMGIPGFLPARGPDILAGVAHDAEEGIDTLAAKVFADPVAALTDTHRWTNLSTFLQRGGKAMFFHGVSDPWFSFWDTVDYFERAAADNGAAAWSDAGRLYAVAGMGHCGGGTAHENFDLLGPLIEWVENGRAPEAEQVVARARSTDGGQSERPLCPWPMHAHYDGAGDPAVASSYACSP